MSAYQHQVAQGRPQKFKTLVSHAALGNNCYTTHNKGGKRLYQPGLDIQCLLASRIPCVHMRLSCNAQWTLFGTHLKMAIYGSKLDPSDRKPLWVFFRAAWQLTSPCHTVGMSTVNTCCMPSGMHTVRRAKPGSHTAASVSNRHFMFKVQTCRCQNSCSCGSKQYEHT